MIQLKYKKVFEEEPGGCGQYRSEVIHMCSLKDEPVFAWRKDQGQKGGHPKESVNYRHSHQTL